VTLRPLDFSLLSLVSSSPEGRLVASLASLSSSLKASPKAVRLARERLVEAGLLELAAQGLRSTKANAQAITEAGRLALDRLAPDEGQERGKGQGQDEGQEEGKGGQRGVISSRDQEKRDDIEDRDNDKGQDDKARGAKRRGKGQGQSDGERLDLALAAIDRLTALLHRDPKPANILPEAPWPTPTPSPPASASTPGSYTTAIQARATASPRTEIPAAAPPSPADPRATTPTEAAPITPPATEEPPSSEELALAKAVERSVPGLNPSDLDQFPVDLRARRAKCYVIARTRHPKKKHDSLAGYYLDGLHKAAGTSRSGKPWTWSSGSERPWSEIVAWLVGERLTLEPPVPELLALAPPAPPPVAVAPPDPAKLAARQAKDENRRRALTSALLARVEASAARPPALGTVPHGEGRRPEPAARESVEATA
jgi:hypothetical protein